MEGKWFVVSMAAVIILGFVIAFVSDNFRIKKFRKVFGIDPGKSEAEIKANQPAIDGVIKGHWKRVSNTDARRPKDNPLSEAYDRWEEERALALMALDDACALARTFGYFVENDNDLE